MLMQVECLEEIVSSVPNTKRRYRITDEITGIDPNVAIAARTFQGSILSSKKGQDFDTESPCHMVDVFYQGGVTVTTILTDELMCALFRKPLDGCAPKSHEATCGIEPKEKPTYLEPKKLTSSRRTVDSWN